MGATRRRLSIVFSRLCQPELLLPCNHDYSCYDSLCLSIRLFVSSFGIPSNFYGQLLYGLGRNCSRNAGGSRISCIKRKTCSGLGVRHASLQSTLFIDLNRDYGTFPNLNFLVWSSWSWHLLVPRRLLRYCSPYGTKARYELCGYFNKRILRIFQLVDLRSKYFFRLICRQPL